MRHRSLICSKELVLTSQVFGKSQTQENTASAEQLGYVHSAKFPIALSGGQIALGTWCSPVLNFSCHCALALEMH